MTNVDERVGRVAFHEFEGDAVYFEAPQPPWRVRDGGRAL